MIVAGDGAIEPKLATIMIGARNVPMCISGIRGDDERGHRSRGLRSVFVRQCSGTGSVPAGGTDDGGQTRVAARGKQFSPADSGSRLRIASPTWTSPTTWCMYMYYSAEPRTCLRRGPRAVRDAERSLPSPPALYASGFTPRRLAPHEAHELLALNWPDSLVRRPTVSVARADPGRNLSKAPAGCCAGGCWPGVPDGWRCWDSRRTTPPPSAGRTRQSVSRRTRSGRRGSGYCPMPTAWTRTILPGRSPSSSASCGGRRILPDRSRRAGDQRRYAAADRGGLGVMG